MALLNFDEDKAEDRVIAVMMRPAVAAWLQDQLPAGFELADMDVEPGLRHVMVRPTDTAIALVQHLARAEATDYATPQDGA